VVIAWVANGAVLSFAWYQRNAIFALVLFPSWPFFSFTVSFTTLQILAQSPNSALLRVYSFPLLRKEKCQLEQSTRPVERDDIASYLNPLEATESRNVKKVREEVRRRNSSTKTK
jgi:hypothetical protein